MSAYVFFIFCKHYFLNKHNTAHRSCWQECSCLCGHCGHCTKAICSTSWPHVLLQLKDV